MTTYDYFKQQVAEMERIKAKTVHALTGQPLARRSDRFPSLVLRRLCGNHIAEGTQILIFPNF